MQQRLCDEDCLCFVGLRSVLAFFSRKAVEQNNRPTFSPPPPLTRTSTVIYTHKLLTIITRQTPRACVCACVIPHMVGYIILSACVCSCGCLVCTCVCAWGCSLMLHIDFNIRDMHAAVTYLTILLPGQPANYHYCHYFTFIVSFYLFSWCV